MRAWWPLAGALGWIAGPACAPPPPVSPVMIGCYRVLAPDWSPGFANATGIRSLPDVIGIDSSPDRRVLVPHAWRLQPPEFRNRATWTEHMRDWVVRDDSVIQPGTGRYHRLGQDSLVVTWLGWGGSATAFLARTSRGFAGHMQISSRTAQTVPGIRLSLERVDCAPHELWYSAP